MDIYDQATVREEQERDIALNSIRNRKPVLEFKGACFNCDAVLHAPMRQLFCDCDCRDDWTKRNRNK